ncbi:FKBP-type peptidyl-prolyl cis-trans isomerase [Gimesia sp.]|uniref:FKBP-type peptidyl-prolyl cis-trans isomerase n=1 Tax=Gimesia sp. TaxID=2024833 RepID=UPI003A8FACF6
MSDETTPGYLTTASGLKYRIVREGSDVKPGPTDHVTVHYRGTLEDGTEFDSSYSRGKTISFPLNGVIRGWTEGLQLIGEGGEIELIIPSELGYGAQGSPPVIPGGATLHFRVELFKVN